MTPGVVVVGGSVGGLRVAQALRREGYDGAVTIVERERHLPYDKPPLSKAALSSQELPETVWLSTAEALDELQITYRHGVRAEHLDLDRAVLVLEDGDHLDFEHLVVATGSAPRRLAPFDGVTGCHVLRTLDDAHALRDAMRRSDRVVVIGGGFIGAELASTARSMGLEATIVEAATRLMERVFPTEVSDDLLNLQLDHEVRVELGTSGEPVVERGRLSAVLLDDGARVPADLAVVAVGTSPNTEWLRSSGVPLGDGVVCDASLRVSGTDNVYAIGDAARWFNPRYGRAMRVEHWTAAREQAALVARNIVRGGDEACELVPFVWSEQHGVLVQHAGECASTTGERVDLTPNSRVYTHYRDGRPVGITGLGAPAHVARFRRDVLRPST